MFFSPFSKSAFSRHDNVRASSTLFILLDENVRLPTAFSATHQYSSLYSATTRHLYWRMPRQGAALQLTGDYLQ